MNILCLGLDYLMIKDDKVRGDVRARQLEYAKSFNTFHMVIYSPKALAFVPQTWGDNLFIYPTNSVNKVTFMLDAYRLCSVVIKRHQIDVVTVEDPFTTGLVGYFLKKRFKIRLNVQVHIDFLNNPYWMSLRKINKIFNRLGQFVLKQADTVRCGTRYEKHKLSQLGIREDMIAVIPVNSEVRKFQDVSGQQIREKYLNNKHSHLLLFTGRLVKQKDIPTLLKALRAVRQHLPDILLLIVGSGAEEEALKKLTAGMGLSAHVKFAGSVPHDDIPRFLAACDVYVVPSIFEGTCIAMTEAMSAGKPVVVTRFAGAEDLVVDGETGYKVPIRDDRLMAERILLVLKNPEQAKKMGLRARRKIEEEFTSNADIKKVVHLWQKTAE